MRGGGGRERCIKVFKKFVYIDVCVWERERFFLAKKVFLNVYVMLINKDKMQIYTYF